MSDDAWPTRMSEDNRRTFSTLQQRGVLEVKRIKRDVYAGGKYRGIECELADALVSLGGGKGTYSVGREMLKIGKPVLPLDLDIGAFSEDGEGSLLLHWEMQADPSLFFPATHRRVVDLIEAVSLQGGSIDGAARRAVEILSREMNGSAPGGSSGVKRWFLVLETAVMKLLTIIGVLRAWDFVRQMVNLG